MSTDDTFCISRSIILSPFYRETRDAEKKNKHSNVSLAVIYLFKLSKTFRSVGRFLEKQYTKIGGRVILFGRGASAWARSVARATGVAFAVIAGSAAIGVLQNTNDQCRDLSR